MNKQKISVVALILLLFSLSGCKTDLSDVFNRLDNHESRLKNMEEKIKSANTEIGKLDDLIKAQAGKISITSYKELADKSGYELTMSDGSKIVLKNGKDGAKPVVGVKKHTDGQLYWTIDGEFMKDADGKLIKAQPTDGVTPSLRVNANNHWEVSLDGGKTWQEVLGADGKPVSATGKPGADATAQLEIIETEDAIIIKYNGSTFTVPKKQRFKLPIEYVAEYNVNNAGDGFSTDNVGKSSGLFNWYEAVGQTHAEHNPGGKNIFAAPAFKDKYHLPSMKEWRVVLPDKFIAWDGASNPKVKKDLPEEIEVAGKTATYTADYDRGKGNGICYAIRFKGNGDKYRAAYRYLYTNNPQDTESKAKKMFSLTVCHLGPNKTDITLEQVADEKFWKQDGVEYITRVFPATGYKEPGDGDKRYRDGEQGFYWSSTEQEEELYKEKFAISMNFYELHFDLTSDAYNYKRDFYGIRPFSNK